MDKLLAHQSALLISLTLGVLMLAVWRVGLRMGERLRGQENVARWSKFDDGSLAILGLLLGFTFGMSLNRHDDRRLMVIRDSNAIGDFYTCASLLGEPVRSKLQAVIRQYAELRLAASRATVTPQDLARVITQSQQLHDRMIALVGEALSAGTPIAVPLTNTLNNLTSMHAERVGAVENNLPASIVLLLVVAALVAMLLVGREQGFEDKSEVPATISFIVIVALALYVTLDLNQPQRGLERVSQAPMERVLRTMNPPPPAAPK
jgi:hypothetical protein